MDMGLKATLYQIVFRKTTVSSWKTVFFHGNDRNASLPTPNDCRSSSKRKGSFFWGRTDGCTWYRI